MGNKCWAASLGGCAGKPSREHIVSSAFFEGGNVTAAGFDWTGEKVQEISLKSAVAKVLCMRHNNQLSELDTEIKKIGKSFKEFTRTVVTDTEQLKSPNQFVAKVNGTLFERWLLKTTLNVICASPKKYSNFWPDEYLACLVYGKTKFNYKTGMGLYFLNPKLYGNMINSWNVVNVRPLIMTIEGDTGLMGVVITFWGMPFFLKTAAYTENLRLDVNGFNLIDEKLYHSKSIYSLEEGKLVDFPRLEFNYET